MQLLQDAIAVRPFRLIENVETAEPRGQGQAGQEQDGQSPAKIVDAPPNSTIGVWLLEAIKPVIHLAGSGKTLRVQADGAASNDVPQPQVRAAFGFTI